MTGKTSKEPRWWLDTREKNKEFKFYEADEDWISEPIKLSRIFYLDEDEEDADIADFTNENFDGMVEFKTVSDMVGSTTGDGVEHLEEQAIRLHALGVPAAIIVHGDPWTFMRISRTNLSLFLSAMQKITVIVQIFNIPVIFALNEEMAIEEAKTFIRHAGEVPRRLPLYNKFKRTLEEHAVIVTAGYKDIGPTLAERILEAYGSIHAFHEKISELVENWLEIVDKKTVAKALAAPVHGVGDKKMLQILETVFKRF